MRSPEDVRRIKRYQRYCSIQRDEILQLRAELYRAQALLMSFEETMNCLKAIVK